MERSSHSRAGLTWPQSPRRAAAEQSSASRAAPSTSSVVSTTVKSSRLSASERAICRRRLALDLRYQRDTARCVLEHRQWRRSRAGVVTLQWCNQGAVASGRSGQGGATLNSLTEISCD